MHHNLLHQELDDRLPVLKASLVDLPPQQSTKWANMVRDVFPRDRRVALRFHMLLRWLAPLEPLRALRAAGRQSV
jgi:hypothetical protein